MPKTFFFTSRRNKKAVEGLVPFLRVLLFPVIAVLYFLGVQDPPNTSHHPFLCASLPRLLTPKTNSHVTLRSARCQFCMSKNVITHKPKIRTQSLAGLTHSLQVTCYLEKPLALWGRLLFSMRTTGQSAHDLNNIKTQCTVPALQPMLFGQGLLGRIVPAHIVNNSSTPIVSNYQLLAHQHMTNDVI